MAAFASITVDGPSQVFYRRKRAEGKRHIQAVIALARRLVDVIWALLRDEREFQLTAPARTAAAWRRRRGSSDQPERPPQVGLPVRGRLIILGA